MWTPCMSNNTDVPTKKLCGFFINVIVETKVSLWKHYYKKGPKRHRKQHSIYATMLPKNMKKWVVC